MAGLLLVAFLQYDTAHHNFSMDLAQNLLVYDNVHRRHDRSSSSSSFDYVKCFYETLGFGGTQNGDNNHNNVTAAQKKRQREDFCRAPCLQELQHLFRGAVLPGVRPMVVTEEKDQHNNNNNNTTIRPPISLYVNSPGGVGSTFVNQLLRHGLHFKLNNHTDSDKLKHVTPSILLSCPEQPYPRATRIEEYPYSSLTNDSRRFERCVEQPPPRASSSSSTSSRPRRRHGSLYADQLVANHTQGIIYVYGSSSAHALFSLYSRDYQWYQYHKLHADWKQLSPDQATLLLDNVTIHNLTWVLERTARAGRDVFGLQRHAQQWQDLQDVMMLHGVDDDDDTTMSTRLRTSELQEFAQQMMTTRHNHRDYFRQLRENFPPIFITDVASIREAPAVLAAVLGFTEEELTEQIAQMPAAETTSTNKKLTAGQEEFLVQSTGAYQVYSKLDHEMQQRIKQNYLLFGWKLLCQ